MFFDKATKRTEHLDFPIPKFSLTKTQEKILTDETRLKIYDAFNSSFGDLDL